jgi:hypothetical protein
LTPSARSANLIAGDGTKNGFPAPNKEPPTNQKHDLTGKAPYKFESISLHRRVNKLSVPLKTAPVVRSHDPFAVERPVGRKNMIGIRAASDVRRSGRSRRVIGCRTRIVAPD